MPQLIIIDDEPNAREAIENIVRSRCKHIQIAATAENVKSGLEAINKYNPDIVLLDIKMPDGTGFDLLKRKKEIDFKVIFISAHDDYAVQAFKFSALDYLLKPVDEDELVAAIKKAETSIDQKNISVNLNTLYENLHAHSKDSKKLILRSAECIDVVSIKDIVRCESEGSYTRIHLRDGRKIIVSKNLKEYEHLLGEYSFFRTHQSHLINTDYLESYKKADGGFVQMKDKSMVPVASRKRDELLVMISNM